jgi:hypothetical protein
MDTSSAGTDTEDADTTQQDPPDNDALAHEHVAAITQRSAEDEARVAGTTAANRQRIASEFTGTRRALSALVARSSASVQGLITGTQEAVRATATGAVAAVRSRVAGTVQEAGAQGNQARASLEHLVADTVTALQGRVQGIAGHIRGILGKLPLPAVPGAAQLRAAAGGLVNRAAAAVTSGLGQVRSLIGSALRAGLQLLTSLLAGASRLANGALSRASAAIQRGVQAISRWLGQIAASVGRILYRALTGTVLPALHRHERRLVQNLGTAQRQAVRALRANRDQHARAVTVAGTAADPTALRGVSEAALQNSRIVAQTFDERTTGILTSLSGSLAGGAARLGEHINGLLSRVTTAVQGTIAEATQSLAQIVTAVGSALQTALGALGAALTSVVQAVRAAVQQPAGELLQFAGSALSRITGFAGRLMRTLLSGTVPSVADVIGVFRPTTVASGPIVKPPPGGPITRIVVGLFVFLFAAFGAIIVTRFRALEAVIKALTDLGLSPMVAYAVLGLAVLLALGLALVVVLLLLKLIWPSPPTTPPAPAITHTTKLRAPDGSPANRTDIGVGESVVFKGNVAGAWTTSAGKPRIYTGKKFTWTAPDRKDTVTVTLVVGTASVSVTLRVVEPDKITAVKTQELKFGVGNAGAGMKLRFHFHPDTVSFGRVEAKEVSGPATKIDGYYKKYSPADLYHHSGDKFYVVRENNDDSELDTAFIRGNLCKPKYKKGSFRWVIPNHFKTWTESGNGKKFTDVIQAFEMVDNTGKIRITKAGAEVERSPSDP